LIFTILMQMPASAVWVGWIEEIILQPAFIRIILRDLGLIIPYKIEQRRIIPADKEKTILFVYRS
jgi:hypothetical protein